ncbi:MAG: hypothetical protein ABSH11_07270 [Verrucomicrobiota bacterium]
MARFENSDPHHPRRVDWHGRKVKCQLAFDEKKQPTSIIAGTAGFPGSHRVLYFRLSRDNKFLTTLSNMATDLSCIDMETCDKLFRRKAPGKITIQEDRHGFEPEITAKVNRLNPRVCEGPISYHGRTYDKGKNRLTEQNQRATPHPQIQSLLLKPDL